MSLLVVIPFCEKDSKLALDLLGWIAELGKHPDNPCLLVADSRLTKLDYEHHVDAATKVFKSVDVIKTPFALPDEKWPIGANWSFETTARHVQFHTEHKAWLWLEPDCVPMRESWLADVEADYIKAGKPFMGRLFQPRKEGLPVFMMTGIGVYPHDLPKRMFQRLVSMRGKAWDVSCADLIVPQAHHSRLFWNFHNRNDQPTYRLILKEDSPKNSILVTSIDPKAALVHTCKDGSLIQCLRKIRNKQTDDEDSKEQIPSLIPANPRCQKIFHVYEEHRDTDPRVKRAQATWKPLYVRHDLSKVPLKLYHRSSLDLGDTRCLPYVKDIFRNGMAYASLDDIILFSNSDIAFHPKLGDVVSKLLDKQPCAASMRVEVDRLPNLYQEPERLSTIGPFSYGRDVFAFRNSWLIENWNSIPDFIIGELEWDLVMTLIIKKANGKQITKQPELAAVDKDTDIPLGLVFHEKHRGGWLSKNQQKSPAKLHNAQLAKEWYTKNGLADLYKLW